MEIKKGVVKNKERRETKDSNREKEIDKVKVD